SARVAYALGAVAMVGTFGPQAKADDCAPVFAASKKQAFTPYKASIAATQKLPPGLDRVMAPTQATESIYVGSRLYMKLGGKWISQPFPPQTQLARIDTDAKTGKTTCRRLPDEKMNGEPVSVFTTHQQVPESTVDMKIWISKSRGLPLRADSRI